MPFIPHTEEDVRAMLAAIGVASIDALFDEIPPALRTSAALRIPAGASEIEVMRLMRERAERDGTYLNFIGAGAYEHHIPAAVWQLATRGEFYTSYTPYQAEASQGTLQVLYEYQTMMASLLALDVANASLYDGASALAEAVLMAVRAHKGARRVLAPRTLNPVWRKVARTITRNQGIELVEIDYDRAAGHTSLAALQRFDGEFAALVVPQPNYFGVLEPVDELVEWAHARGIMAIAAVNPVALAILTPPGVWGGGGADIAVGEGQPLGVPLASGGPYFGFMACRKALVRQMPGRLVGATVDAQGRRGYTLTLQAREQHIRRSKATSNICTNQGLMVTAATIYMALLGPAGLAQVARTCHGNALDLRDLLTAMDGVERAFDTPFFHEFVVRLKTPVGPLLQALKTEGILGGFDLAHDYPELGASLLVCATETKTAQDLKRYSDAMARVIGGNYRPAPCAINTPSSTMEAHNGMANVTLGGNPITVAGKFPAKGEVAPDFALTSKDLKDVSLKDFAGKRKVLNIVPSLDTPVCAKSTRIFNERASALSNTVVLVISADLPFAMNRFCGAEGINNVVTLSTVRSRDFHAQYGVDITDGPLKGLTARAVVVLDEGNRVLHCELVPEIKNEPDYDAALAALK